jgi:hypothetical protein
MKKPAIDVKNLFSSENPRVADFRAELEASREPDASTLWTEKLSPSTRGGKELA